MNYRVGWNRVRDELDRILENAPDKVAVLQAVLRLDAALGYCPERTSESREGKKRVAFEPPLIAYLEVLEAESRVQILELRYREKPERL